MSKFCVRNSKRFLLVVIACTGAIAPGIIAAQSAAAPLTFEVATVKPSDPNKAGGNILISENKFETEGQTLKATLKFAYGLNMGSDQQVIGGPDWIGSAKFDIEAKEDAQAAEALQKLTPDGRTQEIRLMLRALLEDRFKLKVHHETRDLPVYALTVAKGGVKMKSPSDSSPVANGSAPKGWHGLSIQGRGQIEGRSATTSMFTNVIARLPEIGGRLVVDKTGLTGKYDFLLKWTPDASLGSTQGRSGEVAPDADDPSFFTALQEELGLKLESTKAPVDVIVIDSVEMPSDN